MKKLIIKSVKIENFRNIKEISLNFLENANFITGDNATGKTTILDAIRYMIFNQNDNQKKVNNVNFIDSESKVSDRSPDIVMIISFNDKDIQLRTTSKKWFIDDIECANNEEYRKLLAREFKIDHINLLFTSISPLSLSSTLFENKSGDSKQLKDTIITIINKKNGNIINQDDFNKSIEDIESLRVKIKDLKYEIKSTDDELKIQKKSNPTINFDINYNDEQEESDKETKVLQEQKYNYELMNKKRKSLMAKVQDLEIKYNTNSNASSNSAQKQQIKRKLTFLEKILIIMTLGLYYLFYLRNKNVPHENTNVNSFVNLEREKKILSKEIEKTKQEINTYEKELSEINYQKIVDRILVLEEKKSASDSVKVIVNRFNKKCDELNKKRNNLEKLEASLIRKQKEKLDMSNKIASVIKDEFVDFDLDLMSNEHSILIKKNGIEWKYLNNATMLNITYQLNDFLKQYNNLDCFSMIDNAEQINDLKLNKTSQYLISKVTMEKDIKLNGKNIY